MAYQYNYLEDEKNKADAGAGAQRSTSGVVGGTVDTSTPGNGAPAGAAPANASAPTSGFVNLDRYLQANQGKGGQMASDITGDLVGQAKQYNDDAAKAAGTDFMTSAGNDQVQKLKSGLRSDASGIKGAAKDFLGSDYGGPKVDDVAANYKLEDATKLAGRLNKIDDAAEQASRLQTTYGATPGSNYTSGFANLDQFLLSGDQSGRDVINGVKAQAGDVQNAHDTAYDTLQRNYGAATAQFGANKDALRNEARSAIGDIEARGTANAQAANKAIDRSNIGYKEAGLGYGLTDKDRLDLQALAELSGQGANAAWNDTSFDLGHAAPPPVPTVTTGAAGSNPLPGAEAIGAAGKAGGDAADAAKKYRDPNEAVKTLNDLLKKALPGGGSNNLPGKAVDKTTNVVDKATTYVSDAGGKVAGARDDLKKGVSKYCFAHGTRVAMADGSTKRVQDLVEGDQVAEGGEVLSTTSRISRDVHRHAGMLIGGGHAIFDGHRWLRIGEGVGERVLGSHIVYPVVTEHHLLVAEGHLFADDLEVPGVEDDAECLRILNADTTAARSIHDKLNRKAA